MPVIAIRPTGAEKIRRHCAVIYNQDLANHIGVHAAQVSRVLSGKHKPGNQFIAGVIERCGLKFAFDHVFEIVEPRA